MRTEDKTDFIDILGVQKTIEDAKRYHIDAHYLESMLEAYCKTLDDMDSLETEILDTQKSIAERNEVAKKNSESRKKYLDLMEEMKEYVKGSIFTAEEMEKNAISNDDKLDCQYVISKLRELEGFFGQ